MLPSWLPRHWVGGTHPNRFDIAKSWVYRTIGRLALVLALLAGIDNRLGDAVACLAVALWTMWSTHDDLMRVAGEEFEDIKEILKREPTGRTLE
jgi:hypothetical protein